MLPLWIWLLASTPGDVTLQGDAAYKAGDLAKALDRWGQALESARADGDGVAEFELMLRIAAAYRRLGKVETAAKALEAAEKKASLPVHKGQLELDRASTDLAAGDLASAEKGYASAFKELRAAKDPIGAASAALNLGIVRRARGESEDAKKAFAAAGTLFDALEDEGGRAALLLERCRLARQDGDLGSATKLCEEAGSKALSAQEHAVYVDVMLLKAEIFTALGRSGAAQSLLRAALQVASSRKDVVAQARLHNALAGNLLAKGDGRAREHLELAEKSFTQVGQSRAALQVAVNLAMLDGGRPALQRLLPRAKAADDPHLEATLLLNLAALGDTAALDRAGKLIDKLQHPDLLWRHRYLAGKQRLAKDPTDTRGVELLREAVDELERRRRSVAQRNQTSAKAFVTEHDDVYRALVDAYTARGEDKKAYVWAQRLSEEEAAPDDPALASLAVREEELARRLEEASDPEQQEQLAKQLAALRVEFARTIDEMRASVTDFDRKVRVDPEDLEAVQQTLPPGVTVLQPVLLEKQAVLMVLRKDTLKIVRVPLDQGQVQGTIRRLSRSLQGRYLDDLEWTQTQAERLGDWLLKPIDGYLDETEVLVISANGALREVPFAMLRWDDKYAIERFAVASVTNVASLSRQAPPFDLSPKEVLLVGNPDGTLPGAEDEVGELHQRLPGADALVGPQGTRDAVTSKMQGKKVVHLATHGRIDRNRPVDSFLALSGDEATGRLSYQEIPGLAVQLSDCRLVVLSACQSGVAVKGKEKGEGGIVVSINGLAAQFRRAGVETLVASLWSVDDEGTRRLMTGMYDELVADADIAQAMRRSQLRMLADPGYAHPWYWSSFVVVGDWR